MRDKKTVVIITDNSSRNTSAAIKEVFKEKEGVLTIIIAENELEGYFKNTLFNYLFKEESRLRNYYHKFMELRKTAKMDKLASKKVSFNIKSPVHRRMQNVFLRYTPDIVIAMTPKALMASLAARDKLKSKAKVCVVIDEFCLNKQLVSNQTDFYFVDNYDIKDQLVNCGIDENKILISNIPVRKHIRKEMSREEALKVFDLEDKPTLMVIASQYGDDKFKKVIGALYEARLDVNVIVACGYSRRLLAYVRERTDFIGLNEGIDINAGYSCADIVITRPTATVIGEALYKKKLIFSMYPSGEMEKRTLEYLGLDIIVKIDNENQLISKIREYLDNKDNFEATRRMAESAVEGEPVIKITDKLYEFMREDEQSPRQN